MTQPAVSLEYYPANWSTNRAGAAISAIVVHNTVGRDSRAYLKRGGDAPDGSDKKVSVHILARKDGTLYRYLDDTRGANHAGFGTMPQGFPQVNPNRCTLGIELENASSKTPHVFDPYPDSQLLAFGWQINSWRNLHGHIPILLHRELDPTRRADPVWLTTDTLETWCVRAAEHYNQDPFIAWGPIGKPGGDARSWAIPQKWLTMKGPLGACVSPETYSASGRYSVAEFQGGIIIYHVRRNIAIVELF